jgi:hypothetical protein
LIDGAGHQTIVPDRRPSLSAFFTPKATNDNRFGLIGPSFVALCGQMNGRPAARGSNGEALVIAILLIS